MSKYRETMEKIRADGELKGRIIAKASEPVLPHSETPKSTRRRTKLRFAWNRIAAAVMVLIITAAALTPTLLLRPRTNNEGENPLWLDHGDRPWTSDGGNLPWTDDGVSQNAVTPVMLSRDDIIERLKPKVSGLSGDDLDGLRGTVGLNGDVVAFAESSATAQDVKPAGNDYATTNVQQEGVDEGDIIKVDNNYIYTLSRTGLLIVEAGNKMKISYEESYENFYPEEMFIFGDKLIVIGGHYSELLYYNNYAVGVEPVPYRSYRTGTMIMMYGLNDRVNVGLLKKYYVTGYFVTSRLIGDKLIVAVNHSIYLYNEDSYFPKINEAEINAGRIFWYDTKDNYYSGYMYTVLVSLNLSDLTLDCAAHVGLNGVTYFSKDYVYFFNTIYDNTYKYEDGGYSYAYEYGYRTLIVKISLATLKYAASQKIDGMVQDRYWADEYDGNLRVVSHFYSYKYEYKYYYSWSQTVRYTNVYVLDGHFNVIGTISDIAPGESIYSVRFSGGEGSIVTYLQIDPLFKLNLSDPKNPTISKGLKEEGVSDYLQYLSKDVILGLGRNSVETNGWTQFMGMKISLYDNTGAEAVNINTIKIGTGYAYSDALNDPKAILNDTAKNMFSFAVTMQGNTSLSLEGQGLMVFEYDLNAAADKNKLVYRGLLTNISQSKTYASWNDYYYDYYSYVKRGARIGDKIYTISDRYITSYNIDTLKLVQRLELKVDPCHFTHKWTEWKTVSATCTKAGEQTRHCQTCGHKQEYVLNAYGHSWGAWTITTMPTATNPGAETRTCSRCGHKEVRQLVGAVGAEGLVLVLNEEGTAYRVRTYMGSSATVNIPADIGGVPINEIENYAFQANSKVKSVTIPKSVISIGYEAFYNCTALQSVTFENDSRLITIGSSAFYGCSSLKTITLPKGLTALPYNLFYRAYALENVFFEEGSRLTAIYSGAFSNCLKLKSFFVPASVTYIANDAFVYNPLLESLTVDSGNTVYKSDGNCIITISANTLLAGCNNSAIPDYVKVIGSYAFCGSGIKNVTIPESVEHISYYAFAYCESLQSVTFENGSGLKTISQYAFADCRGVTSIDIPVSVVNVGYYAFSGWTAAQTINVYGVNEQYYADVKLGVNWRANCHAVIKYFE